MQAVLKMHLKELHRASHCTEQYWRDKLTTQCGNPKKLWSSLNNNLGRQANVESIVIKPEEFLQFFSDKIAEVVQFTQATPPPVIISTTTSSFNTFLPLSTDDVTKLIMRARSTQYSLDPAP